MQFSAAMQYDGVGILPFNDNHLMKHVM